MTGLPPILSVTDLCVDARTPTGLKPVLQDIGFTLAAGETLCLAGESGSGKSVTSLAIMGCCPRHRCASQKDRSGLPDGNSSDCPTARCGRSGAATSP